MTEHEQPDPLPDAPAAEPADAEQVSGEQAAREAQGEDPTSPQRGFDDAQTPADGER